MPEDGVLAGDVGRRCCGSPRHELSDPTTAIAPPGTQPGAGVLERGGDPADVDREHAVEVVEVQLGRPAARRGTTPGRGDDAVEAAEQPHGLADGGRHRLLVA